MGWIERQRGYLDFTLASLARRKGKNISLISVYALIVFLVSSLVFLTNSLLREAEALLEAAPDMVVQRTVGGRHELLPVSYIEKIKAIRGIKEVLPRLWGYYYHPASRSNYTIMVPADFSLGEDEVQVGEGVNRTWVGSEEGRFYFKAADGSSVVLKIAGTLPAATELVSSDLILLGEAAFRKISGVPEGFANDLAVTLGNKAESLVIAEKIVLALPDARPILREEILRTYVAVFDWRGGVALILLSGAVIAFLIFAWDRAAGLSSEERLEIGILKGVGWDTSEVLTMKLWEGTVVSLTAFVIGVIGAYLHVFFASGTIFERALKGWAILYPEFTLAPEISLYHLVALLLMTVGPYTLVTVIPAWKASIADPDSIMRQG